MTQPLPPEQILSTESQPRIMLRRARTADAESLIEAILYSLDALQPFMPWSHAFALTHDDIETLEWDPDMRAHMECGQ